MAEIRFNRGWRASAGAKENTKEQEVCPVLSPADQMSFVSEAIGPDDKGGLRLMPIEQWLAAFDDCISAGNAWAVDPFAMANRHDKRDCP